MTQTRINSFRYWWPWIRSSLKNSRTITRVCLLSQLVLKQAYCIPHQGQKDVAHHHHCLAQMDKPLSRSHKRVRSLSTLFFRAEPTFQRCNQANTIHTQTKLLTFFFFQQLMKAFENHTIQVLDLLSTPFHFAGMQTVKDKAGMEKKNKVHLLVHYSQAVYTQFNKQLSCQSSTY